MLNLIGCITEQHDTRLVALAACICILACGTTVNLMARARQNDAPLLWLLAAAALFGCGVWSLHFVAMLAFMPDLPISYAELPTLISIGIACLGALLAFSAWRCVRSRRLANLLGGVLLGLAIAGMHYCGVSGMRLPGRFGFDTGELSFSVLVGIGCCTIALSRAENLASGWRRAEVAGWLALGICGLHFTGMAALHLTLGVGSDLPPGLGSASMAIVVGSASLAILLVSMAATLMEQHLSQRAVRELHRLRLLSDISRESLLIHRDGIILQANTASGRLLGLPADRLVGQNVVELFAEADQPAIRRRARHSGGALMPEEVQVRTSAGILVPVELSCSAIEYDGARAIAVVLHDLTDRKRDEARIRHLAHHDALTELPNRFLLQERLRRALDGVAETGGSVALLYLDLDRFKAVNDLLGHAAGDTLLQEVAARLRAELRPLDTLARVGGDEFVIVVNVDQPDKAALLAGRVVETLDRPFDLDGHTATIGTSIGIALYPSDAATEERLMHAADTALYRAKEEKGTFRFFKAAMNEHLHARRQLEHDLRHALQRDEFELHYQPLIDCQTGVVEGYEALLRWQHPVRGLVSPAEFIPLAEETGLIRRIGEWVIATACRTAASWEAPHWVAVNVSPVQFQQSDLVQIVAGALVSSGLPASRLEIEITEGILIEDSERAIEVLLALRGLGVRIALDDFGTGYSSLSYLRSFRFDKLKIDQSFIRELGQSEDAITIVRTIIGLAHNLGLAVTAEGVETPEQLAAIRQHLCDEAQGYLLGRPAPMRVVRSRAAA